MQKTARFLTVLLIALAPVALAEVNFTNPGPGGGSDLWTLEFHPTDPDTFLLGGDIEGPFKTTDGGKTYRRVSEGLANSAAPAGVYASQDFAYDPGNPDTVFLAGWSGVYRSTDGAESWTLVLPEPPLFGESGDSFSAVAVSPHDSNIVLAGNGNPFTNQEGAASIMRSADGGTSWASIDLSGIFNGTDVVFHTIVFDPGTSGVVYAATGEGILKSSDNGSSWALKNSGLPTADDGARPAANHLVGAVKDGQHILFTALLTNGKQSWNAAGIYRSTDGAETWVDISGDLPQFGDESNMAYSYWRVTVDPFDPDNLIVGTRREWAWDQIGVYRTSAGLNSDTSSISWTWLWDPSNFSSSIVNWGWLDPDWWKDQHVHFLGYSPLTEGRVITGSDNVYISNDHGSTWDEAYLTDNGDGTFSTTGLELMVTYDATVDPTNRDIVWVGYDDMGLFKSEDGGTSFRRMDAEQNAAALSETDCACQVVVDPADGNTLYMVRHGGDEEFNRNWSTGYVYKSTDAGGSWAQLGASVLEGGRPYLLMLPGGDTGTRTLLAGIYGKGLYRSTDSGENWVAVTTDIDSADQKQIWSLAAGTEAIYLGTADMSSNDSTYTGAVYRSTDQGVNWSRLTGSTVPTGQVLALSIASDATLYAATTTSNNWLQTGEGTSRGGLYRSADSGASWGRVISQPRVDGVSVRADDPAQVIASVSSYWNQLDDGTHDLVAPGIYLSEDAGLTFSRLSGGPSHRFFWFVEFDPLTTSRFFAGSRGGGLFVGEIADAASRDTDDDGVVDSEDAFPADASETTDTDGDGIGNNVDGDDDNDGIPDASERSFGLDPLSDDAAEDPDNDGLTNLEEYTQGSDPKDTFSPTYPSDIAESARRDFNGDGHPDLLIRRSSGGWYLYLMQGRSVIGGGAINATSSLDWQPVSFADFDGDSRADILIRHKSLGLWWLYTLDGSTILDSARVAATRDLAFTPVAFRDADGDAKADILLRHSDGRWWRYGMDGASILSQGGIAATRSTDFAPQSFNDFDGDGKADLLLRNTSNGIWWLYTLSGNTITTSAAVGATRDLNWTPRSFSDFDGDGRADLLIRHTSTNGWWLYTLNGNSLTSSSRLPASSNASWHPVATEDFDNDGRTDLLLRNESGAWWLYTLNGSTITSTGRLWLSSSNDWRPVSFADFNADSKADVLVRNVASGRWWMYLLDARTILSEGSISVTSQLAWQLQGD